MAEPPELPPRTKTQTSDKSLPRPPEVADANDVDIVIDAPTPTNGDTSILFNHDEFHSTLLEDRDVYRPLPTVPSKGELAEKSEKLRKYSDSPRQSALMVGMNSTFAKEVAESIAMPTDSIIPEHWVSSTANKRKSNDGVSTKSGNSVKLNSTPAETKKLEDGHSAEDPNKETNIAEVSPNKRNSTSKSITESNKSKSPEPQPVLDRRQTTSPSNTQVKILDAQNNTASTNNSSIPSVENPSVNSNIVPAPAAININTAPVPIYAGGIFLGYGKSNTPTRPAMVPHNQQLYARPR